MNIILWANIGKIFTAIISFYIAIVIIRWVIDVNDSVRRTWSQYHDLSEFRGKWLGEVNSRLKKLEENKK